MPLQKKKKKKKKNFWDFFVAYHYTDACCTQIKSFPMKQLPIAKNLKITINFF